jgi:hypothetical protein
MKPATSQSQNHYVRLRVHFSCSRCLRCSRCPRSRRTTRRRFLAARSHRSIRNPSLPAGASCFPRRIRSWYFSKSTAPTLQRFAMRAARASGRSASRVEVTRECGATGNAETEKQFLQPGTVAVVAPCSKAKGGVQSGAAIIAGKAFLEVSKTAQITRNQPRILKNLRARKCLLAVVSQNSLFSSI